MSGRYIVASAGGTLLSFVGLQWWLFSFLAGSGVGLGDARQAVDLLLGSSITVALFVNLAINAYILLILCLKMIFFKQLHPSESRKLLEHLINYVVCKGTFLPLVIPPNLLETILWSAWLVMLCSIKMFLSLAKDRLERLNASPSTTPIKYFRVFSALLLVLAADLFWIRLCMVAFTSFRSTLYLLSFFEPLSIAFETLLAVMIHGFQLIDIWHRHSIDNGTDFLGSNDLSKSAAGSLAEWKGFLIRNCGFLLDMLALIMAVGHYLMIWWLHGMAFHLVDAVLFLNLRAILSAMVKRVKGFIKLRKALHSLDGALPDATSEELSAFNDECAICRGPMARAKKLSCNHLFHLACLRSCISSLAQQGEGIIQVQVDCKHLVLRPARQRHHPSPTRGLTEVYSCPTCRRPLFASSSQDQANSISRQFPNDQSIVDQVRGNHQRMAPAGAPAFPNQQQNASDTVWRGVGLGSNWVTPWTSSRMDGAGTSTAIRSVGLTGMQMMMRQLASVGENYPRGSVEASSWNLWPSYDGSATSSLTHPSPRNFNRNMGGVRHMNLPPPPNLLSMVDRIREVLPHIPDELIIQDLLRTNNINITVNNLLVMQ